MLENCKTNNLTQNESATVVYKSVSQLPGHCVQKPPDVYKQPWPPVPYSSYNQSCGCLRVCVCVRAFVYALKIVSTDNILCFINTLIISSTSSSSSTNFVDLTTV